MASPELTHTGQRLYDALAPLAEGDGERGYALAYYCGALARVLDQLADLSRDTDDLPGWGALLDPDEVPDEMVDYLAQFIGVVIPGGVDAATAREWLRNTDGRNRGTPAAIAGAARAFLTGAKTVYLIERHGSPYKLTVTTWASETPDPGRVEAAVRAQKPAGIVLTYSTINGGDYETLRDTHSDYSVVAELFEDYAEVRADPAKE